MPENDAIAVLRGSAEARQCRGAPRPKNGRGGNVGGTWGKRGGKAVVTESIWRKSKAPVRVPGQM